MTTSTNAGWIESPKYDLGFLILAPLLGLVVCALALLGVDPYIIAGTSLFLLGMPHYLSTYSYYFDDRNTDYARQRAFAFWIGPLLIIFGLAFAVKLKYYMLIALVVDAWNIFHVSRQSTGILSVYRHLNGGDNRREKLPANFALLCIGSGLYSFTIAKQPSFSTYLKRLSFDVMPFLGPVLLTIGIASLATLLFRMWRRGAPLPTSELIFVGTSALLFLPYVLIPSRTTASSAMLSGHYLQYLGILWLLNHRKYVADGGSVRQRALTHVSRSVPRIVLLLLGIVAVSAGIDRYVHHVNAMGIHNYVLNLIVLMHFYLDGLVWAFKHPYTRATMGPYLLLPDHRVAAAMASPMPIPAPAVG
ncbi:MAG: hypothetical protein QOI24_1316 [Acidobacteriota bacterium]|jgi:hypothetical protein|nr:hypothetical protein [Acidobacteriota bacterium]